MTAPAPVAAQLTTTGRLQLLLDLHHQAGTMPLIELMPRLRELAHQSLPWEQVVATFEGHQRCVDKANELWPSGTRHWDAFYCEEDLPDCHPCDRDDAARWLLEDEARALMWTLATGEC